MNREKVGSQYKEKQRKMSCRSLSSITLPSSVKSIGDYAFSYCSSLTSIIIPESVASIGRDAFIGCNKLEVITASSRNQHFKSFDGELIYESVISHHPNSLFADVGGNSGLKQRKVSLKVIGIIVSILAAVIIVILVILPKRMRDGAEAPVDNSVDA